MNLNKNEGFTLVELLVVVAVLGILVLLATPRLLGHAEKARLTQIKHDVKVVEGLMSEYLINMNTSFPDEWSDVSENYLKVLSANSELYDVNGYAEDVPNGDYKEIDKTYLKENVRTRLGGTFYVNKKIKVFYEDDSRTNAQHDDDLFDREIIEENIVKDQLKVLDYTFPNGIYHNGETLKGDMTLEGTRQGDYYIEFYYTHSKFGNVLSDSVNFSLSKNEVKTIDFELLVESNHLRGFYDFVIIIKDLNDDRLVEYSSDNVVYFAGQEWTYYYEDDLHSIDRPVAGQIGSLSSDRVNYEYVYDESGGTVIDYSSITFDVQPGSNESGQVRSILPETYGTYEAMIKVPDNDSLLNGLFLYGYDDDEYEIDIEIFYYEGKWQVWGTVFNESHEDYVYNGVEPGVIYQIKKDLDFDPSEDYHSYRIDFYEDFISFAVDGQEIGRWNNSFDYGEMHLHAGNFYTHWLAREISDESLEMDVKWIRRAYF